MVDRLYMIGGTSPRIISSKQGYNASPALADIYKTFDSDWFDSGAIRTMGLYESTAAPYSSTAVAIKASNTGLPDIVNFTDMGFVPAFHIQPVGWRTDRLVFNGISTTSFDVWKPPLVITDSIRPYATSSQLIVPPITDGTAPLNREWRRRFIYVIFEI